MHHKLIFTDHSAGALDPQVIHNIEHRYSPLEQDYLDFLQQYHGCTLHNVTISIAQQQYRVAEILTLLDEHSPLASPFQPHFEHTHRDRRLINNVIYLTQYEHSTQQALFGSLLPFATTETQLCLARGYVDLFCFDYTEGANGRIVLWQAEEALTALMDWEDLPLAQQFDADGKNLNIPIAEFILPIADNFAGFMAKLQCHCETHSPETEPT